MSLPARIGLLASVFSLLLLLPGGQGVGDPGSPLAVDDQVSVAGSVDLMVREDGAVHYESEQLPRNLELHAERLTFDYAWETGTTVRSPGEGEAYERVADQDQETKIFRDASVTLDRFQANPELLVYPDEREHQVHASGIGQQAYDRVESSFLTVVGVSPTSDSTNDSRSVGFWYQPDPSWVAGSRSDEATANGNFSLFLNNVTVTAEQEGETVWRNWTGYQEESTGPAASSYERHLLQVHVTNGTLSLAEEDAVTVLGPILEVDASGIVTAETATGRLQLDGTTFAFEEERLRLEGEGRFQVSESSTETPDRLSLLVRDSSAFDVEGGERMDRGPMGSGALTGWSTWISASMFGLLLAGAVAHKAGYTREALQRWRAGRYTKWMMRGREFANAADFGQAATCFRRAARAQPAKGVAWYHLVISLLEDGRPREVLDVVDEAREGEAIIDELDFLEVEAEAARQAGETARCRKAVRQLAEGSEAMASSLARDLALDEDVLGEELANRLVPGEDEGDLTGYV